MTFSRKRERLRILTKKRIPGRRRILSGRCENLKTMDKIPSVLYGGAFTDTAHRTYAVDSKENRKALQLLKNLEGITFDAEMTSMDEIAMFCSGQLAMTFCWNASIEITQTVNRPELDFEIFPMAFPVKEGKPGLQGGIWGFGVFDSGDQKRVEAAKTLIRYMTQNDDNYKREIGRAHV